MTAGPAISGATRLAAVIGWPVAHSLSPVMHNAAFASTGQDWVYVALAVAPDDTRAAIDAIGTLGLGGVSVTMPHKTAMADLLPVVSDEAAALRSVNTIVRRDDGTLEGHSTDGAGFMASLAESAGVDASDARVVVLGAGGAARAVIHALARGGAADVAVANRTHGSAVDAARSAGVRGRAVRSDDLRQALVAADIVVNATSVGMGTDETPCDLSALHSGQIVVDLVYHPLETALLAGARRMGCTVVDGLGMLVHQAARQQQLWTGARPDTGLMRAAAVAELDRRA